MWSFNFDATIKSQLFLWWFINNIVYDVLIHMLLGRLIEALVTFHLASPELEHLFE